MAVMVPHRFVCPITHAVMQDPVVDPHGHTFERKAIHAWLRRRTCCPLAREPLHPQELAPNGVLAAEIDDWRRSCATAGLSLDDEELSAHDLSTDVYAEPVSRSFPPGFLCLPRQPPEAASQCIWRLESPSAASLRFTCCDLSCDGRYALGGYGSAIKVWQVGSQGEIATLKPLLLGRDKLSDVRAALFSPKGDLVCAIYANSVVRVWDVVRETCRLSLKGMDPKVACAALNAAGTRLVCGSVEGTVKAWDVTTGKRLVVARRHTDWVHCVAFSPCGARLASASTDRRLLVCDVDRTSASVICHGHRGTVLSCVFDTLGACLLSASEDGTVKLWNSFTGSLLMSYDGHRGPAQRATLSADGRRVIAVSNTSRLKVWDREQGTGLALVPARAHLVGRCCHQDDKVLACAAAGGFEVWQWRMEDPPRDPTATATSPAATPDTQTTA